MRPAHIPTLYIIDDDEKMLDALSWVAGTNGIETEIYNNALSFLEEFELGQCGCVLIDIRMPDMGGMELHHHLRDIDADLPVILITGYGNISLAVEAMKNDAFDFIEKPIDNDIFLTTVQKAFAINMKHHEDRQNIEEQQAPLQRLSKRERNVFDLVVQGFSSKAIGEQLAISHKTVETHRSNIMRKTEAQSLSDLITLNNNTAPIYE